MTALSDRLRQIGNTVAGDVGDTANAAAAEIDTLHDLLVQTYAYLDEMREVFDRPSETRAPYPPPLPLMARLRSTLSPKAAPMESQPVSQPAVSQPAAMPPSVEPAETQDAACVLNQATHLDVEAEVRYWEDAKVNGVEDSDGTLIPGRDGDLWKVRINLADGRIEGWPDDITAKIHYKVCDAGEYWLSRPDGRRVAKWKGDYVPSPFLCHGDNGYGDYIIMTVAGGGAILNYRQPDIDEDRWATCDR